MILGGDKRRHKRRHTVKAGQDIIHTPNWMKVLGERYERLHAKVLNGTCRFDVTPRFKHQTGRYLQDYRRFNRCNVVSPLQLGESFDLNEQVDRVCERDCNEVGYSGTIFVHLSAADNVKGHIEGTTTRDSEVIALLIHQGSNHDTHALTTKDDSVKEITAYSCDTSLISGVASSNIINSHVSSEDDVNIHMYSQSTNRKTTKVILPYLAQGRGSNGYSSDEKRKDSAQLKCNKYSNVDIADNLITSDYDTEYCDNDVKRRPENKLMENRAVKQLLRRRAKSCVVKGNSNTTISLPLQNLEMDNVPKTNKSKSLNRIQTDAPVSEDLLPVTAKTVQESRMRVFAKMSTEAQQAVYETLKDMKGIDQFENDKISFSNSEHSIPKYDHVNEDSIDSINTPKNVAKSSNSLHNDREEESKASSVSQRDMSISVNISSKCSDIHKLYTSFYKKQISTNKQRIEDQNCGIVNFVNGNKDRNRCFSHLNQNIGQFSSNLSNFHIRFPGIRKSMASLSFKENTFEITPLNFDIRYHQTTSSQIMNRDALSADILRRSIDKCNQWLVRYTPRG